MKKLFLFLLLFVIVLTGCSNETSKNNLETGKELSDSSDVTQTAHEVMEDALKAAKDRNYVILASFYHKEGLTVELLSEKELIDLLETNYFKQDGKLESFKVSEEQIIHKNVMQVKSVAKFEKENGESFGSKLLRHLSNR